MAARINPDNVTTGTGFMDILDDAVKAGGSYLIADKTGAVPAGYSRTQNVGATPASVPPSNSPTMLGANAIFRGVDMRYVVAGFGALLVIGLILRK